MRICTIRVTGPLVVAMMLALSNAQGAAEEVPYLLQGGGEARVLRGLDSGTDFEPATLPEEIDLAPAAAPEPEAKPELTASAETFGKAEGRWYSQRQTPPRRNQTTPRPRIRTTTAKSTFDVYGRMASIPGPFVTFYTADENGNWKGYWVEDSGRQRCATRYDGSYHWGVVQFRFNAAYTQFQGTWDYCGEGYNWKWKGRRVRR